MHHSTVKTEDCHRIFASLHEPKPLNVMNRNWCKSIGQTHNSPKIPKSLIQRDLALGQCRKRWAPHLESKLHIIHILEDKAMRGLCSWSMSIVLIQLITAGFRAFEDQFEHLRVILLGFVIVVSPPPPPQTHTKKKGTLLFSMVHLLLVSIHSMFSRVVGGIFPVNFGIVFLSCSWLSC